MMSVSSRIQDNCIILQPGIMELDFTIAEEWLSAVRAELSKAPNLPLILDFSDIQFIDSKAIGVIVRLHKDCTAQNRRFCIACLQDHPRKIISVVTLNAIFEIQESIKDAVEAMTN